MQNLNQLHLRPECPHHAPSAGTQSWRGQVGMSAPKYWSKIVWLDVLLYKASTERLSECVCVSEGFIIVKNGVLYRAVKYELWNYKKTKKKVTCIFMTRCLFFLFLTSPLTSPCFSKSSSLTAHTFVRCKLELALNTLSEFSFSQTSHLVRSVCEWTGGSREVLQLNQVWAYGYTHRHGRG